MRRSLQKILLSIPLVLIAGIIAVSNIELLDKSSKTDYVNQEHLELSGFHNIQAEFIEPAKEEIPDPTYKDYLIFEKQIEIVEPTPSPKAKPLPEKKEVAPKKKAKNLKESERYKEVAAVPLGTKTSLGEFAITAYCNCSKCCGKWSGQKMRIPTQAGNAYPVEGYTVSVDPDLIPLRSTIEIEGLGSRYAHDTGGAIKGKRIDLYFASHEAALSFGLKKLEIWIYEVAEM